MSYQVMSYQTGTPPSFRQNSPRGVVCSGKAPITYQEATRIVLRAMFDGAMDPGATRPPTSRTMGDSKHPKDLWRCWDMVG